MWWERLKETLVCYFVLKVSRKINYVKCAERVSYLYIYFFFYLYFLEGLLHQIFIVKNYKRALQSNFHRWNWTSTSVLFSRRPTLSSRPPTHSNIVLNPLIFEWRLLYFLTYPCFVCYVCCQKRWIIPSFY